MSIFFQIQIQLKIFKVEEGEEFSSTEELNPDCYVVVYAVDDEQSFGEFFFFLWCLHFLCFLVFQQSLMDFSPFCVVA